MTYKTLNKKTILVSMIVVCLFIILLFFTLINRKEASLIINNGNVTFRYDYNGKEINIRGQKIDSDNYIHLFIPSFCDLTNIFLPSESWTIKDGYYEDGAYTEENTERSHDVTLLTNGGGPRNINS